MTLIISKGLQVSFHSLLNSLEVLDNNDIVVLFVNAGKVLDGNEVVVIVLVVNERKVLNGDDAVIRIAVLII